MGSHSASIREKPDLLLRSRGRGRAAPNPEQLLTGRARSPPAPRVVPTHLVARTDAASNDRAARLVEIKIQLHSFHAGARRDTFHVVKRTSSYNDTRTRGQSMPHLTDLRLRVAFTAIDSIKLICSQARANPSLVPPER